MSPAVEDLTVMVGKASARLLLASLELLRRFSGAVAESLPPTESRLAWQELRNKTEAFEHFRRAASWPGLRPCGPGLAAALDRALGLAPYERLWTLEGLGHALGDSALAEGRPWGLFAADCPAAALPLHTGAGLSFAARAADPAGPELTEELLERFAALCESSARPGCAPALFEALGLAVRTLRPDRIADFDRALRRRGEEPRSLFWHGVGRGLYFLPTDVLPWGDPAGRALAKALCEPPDAASRRQAVGGLSWALALVNIRQPWIVEAFLRSPGCPRQHEEAFAHGAAMAGLVWAAVIGADATLDRFVRHRPGGPLGEIWHRLVTGPCERALRELSPRVREGRFGDLFLVREEGAWRMH